ncbi:MAG TPA: TldD/PmbA family protein [Vicinamibacterales bacterium]|jgi:predicted Zn-dependent protease|nr:TldD/PmbA family protein [Vicinamibacterales bacterium]
MIWTKEQAKALMDRVLSFSKAESTAVNLNGGDRANVRFARNTVTTSGATSGYSLAITSSFGKRSGTVTTAEFDDASLQRAVRNAEEIAKLSPENPEAMPLLGPQTYSPVTAFFDDAAQASPEWRAGSAATAIDLSKKKEVVSAGFVETQGSIRAVANSKGLFAFDRFTSADYNLTARTPDGSGSGWASRSYNELRQLDPGKLATAAIEKAALSKNPAAIEPGKYTVVLEPAAVADLLAYLLFSANARQADEGRSFFSKKGGGNRTGEQVVGEKVRIISDPAHPLAPAVSFDGEGLPISKHVWVENGVIKDLFYSRFWAQKMSKDATAGPGNAIMEGGSATMSDLIAGTDRGVLVTRFWYIRLVDPQTILITGLTRDGLFLIEKGKVTRPVKNMRWNESPVVAFNNIDAMSPPERVVSGEGIGSGGLSIVCPAARIREFTFSSASDAV